MKRNIFLLAVVFAANTSIVKAQKGEIYKNFPESFEVTNQIFDDGYTKKTRTFDSGTWFFYGSLIDSTKNDRASTGKYAVRLNKNNTKPCYLQMNFDLEQGASKVTLQYSSYGAKADKPATFRLEYSLDGGKNWKQSGEDVVASVKKKQEIIFPLDIKGKVRFRVHKLGLGNGDNDATISNGRLSVDDFAVYQN